MAQGKRGNSMKFTPKIKKLFSRGGKYSTPEKRREEAKRGDFLMPGERKFPYKVGGKPSRRLLGAAVRRAKQYGYESVAKKAEGMLAKMKSGNSMKDRMRKRSK